MTTDCAGTMEDAEPRAAVPADGWLGSQYAEIMRLCQRPMSVAEIAAHLQLPAGTVRVLLGDLVDRELVRRRTPVNVLQLPTKDILRAVIDGIRAL